MEIQAVTLNQLDDLVILFDQYMVFYKQDSNPEKYRQYLAERIKNNEASIYLAYVFDTQNKRTPVGFVLNYHSFSSVSQGRVITLNDLFVSSTHRKQGIAARLIDASRALATETDALRVDLSTAKDNVTAQALYEKLGFIRDTEFYSYSLAVK